MLAGNQKQMLCCTLSQKNKYSNDAFGTSSRNFLAGEWESLSTSKDNRMQLETKAQHQEKGRK